jgi:hypothetical protein
MLNGYFISRRHWDKSALAATRARIAVSPFTIPYSVASNKRFTTNNFHKKPFFSLFRGQQELLKWILITASSSRSISYQEHGPCFLKMEI